MFRYYVMSRRFIAMASLLIVPLVVPLAAHSAPLGFSPATPGGFGQPSGPQHPTSLKRDTWTLV
jgi:hypothetical protein